MKINGWAVAAQVLAELLSVQSLQQGESVALPPVHVKSGTTRVDVVITVTEDPPKK